MYLFLKGIKDEERIILPQSIDYDTMKYINYRHFQLIKWKGRVPHNRIN
jgi:hypothetical protein